MVSETQRGDSLAFERLSSQSVCDSHSSSFHKILQSVFCYLSSIHVRLLAVSAKEDTAPTVAHMHVLNYPCHSS